MLLLLMFEFWLLGYVGAAAMWPDNGAASMHWSNWQPWVCLCELHKQARIRHFVVWGRSSASRLKTSQFWQERGCTPDECPTCGPEECPKAGAESAPSSSRLAQPHDVAIPLPPHSDFPSYDSLPVVDDTGDT